MNYSLIEYFLKDYFPDIEGVILFGSYIEDPLKANDIDLLLVSTKFPCASKESFYFKNIKINTIKFPISVVFSVLAKHFQQGDFYRLVFLKGVIIADKAKDLQFIRSYVANSYPQVKNDITALRLNETLYTLSEYKGLLSTSLSQMEFYSITSKIVSNLMDYFFFLNGIYHLNSEKIKSRYFSLYYPSESKKILKLISIIQQNDPKKCLLELESIIDQCNIPAEGKYSNDLVFDDYSQPNLILFIETLFNFHELKEIIAKIKVQNNEISFLIYQVDEDQQEKKGCYIIFNNAKKELEIEKEKWFLFFQSVFSKYQYSFPYNNIFCYPEIKFIGKKNEKKVSRFLTDVVKAISNNDLTKEAFFVNLLLPYVSVTGVKLEDLYNFYLGILNSKTHRSNYLNQKIKQTESSFLNANAKNEKTLVQILSKSKRVDLNLNLENIPLERVWFHFQLIDRFLSLLLKNDFEKLFFIYCLKKSHE